MLAQGCILKDKREEADYIVEARAGAIGTDHQEVLWGVPATTLPNVGAAAPVPAAIPELPLAKKTEQRAVAKISLFAYNRRTGSPVWQSGVIPVESKVKDLWVLGAGPFQRGTVINQMKPRKTTDKPPLMEPGSLDASQQKPLSVSKQAYFIERKASPLEMADAPVPAPTPKKKAEEKPGESTAASDAVIPASHNEPVGDDSLKPATGTDSFPEPSELPLSLLPLASHALQSQESTTTSAAATKKGN
jgi:hypothetical protein